jgi:hypothetical protein
VVVHNLYITNYKYTQYVHAHVQIRKHAHIQSDMQITHRQVGREHNYFIVPKTANTVGAKLMRNR